jgi:DNA-binding PadR family transcriptional regulator
MKEVETLSAGRIVFSTGTLYGALKRLLEQGWIERGESAEPEETGRPRKEYHLTDLGRRILSAEARRLEALAKMAQLKLKDSQA